MSFRAYEQYRASEIDWLGDVPSHWEVAPIKAAFAIVGGSTPKSDVAEYWDGEVPWITPADLSRVTSLKIGASMRTITEEGVDSCGTNKSPAGSVVLSTRAPIGSIAVTTVAACTNQGCKTMVPNGALRSDLLAFSLSVATEQLNVRGRGTTFLELSADELGAFKVPIPPLEEQPAIAAFLDRETAKIDALVEEQRRLVVLLKEKRQAVISRAVTKGLDPAVPMKDSGIEWLGKVPAHWSVSNVGRLCETMSYGFTNPMPTDDDGPYMLTANDIGYGRIEYATARRTTADAFETLLTDKSRPKTGDILLTKDGTLGRVAIHDGQQACINQSVAFLRVRPEVTSAEFLANALGDGVYQDRMIYEAGGSTIKHIYISRLAKMPVAIPTLAEMRDITIFCESHNRTAAALSDQAEEGISLLRERRSVLISAAVTGKIDVRGHVRGVAEAA